MITLISLAGVTLGVMVLVVVMSVMDGFENMVKDRVLGQSPHITAMRVAPWDMLDENGEEIPAETQWRALEKKLEALPSVESAYPLVNDFVIVDNRGAVLPVMMRGIDTEDEQSMADLKKLEKSGDVSIGMGVVAGLDEEEVTSEVGVVSSIFAEANQLVVGDVLEVISNRNIKALKPLLSRKGTPTLYEKFAVNFEGASAALPQQWAAQGEMEHVSSQDLFELRNFISQLKYENLRTSELASVNYLEQLTSEGSADGESVVFEKGTLESVLAEIATLKGLDKVAMDKEEELLLNDLALPKEVRISGIYEADRFAPGPPLLVPLHLAQELAGVGTTGGVNGVSLRLVDPYLAGEVLENEVRAVVPEGWVPVTWMSQFEKEFALISTQKLMMTLALSFIMLIAVFSISAVMFTVTLQKKREIGVMKALGATPAQVTNVFAFQGVIVGFLGSLIGVALSFAVLKNLGNLQAMLRTFGFDPFSKSFYGIDSLPYEMNPAEMAAVCVGAFILCSLAAYVPAWVAARADAAKSLRSL